MVWIEKRKKHEWCKKPADTADAAVGSIWQCDECGQHWLYGGHKIINSSDLRENYEDIWTRMVAPRPEVRLKVRNPENEGKIRPHYIKPEDWYELI